MPSEELAELECVMKGSIEERYFSWGYAETSQCGAAHTMPADCRKRNFLSIDKESPSRLFHYVELSRYDDELSARRWYRSALSSIVEK